MFMSSVFFISDLHFGHKRITSFAGVPANLSRTGDDYIGNMNNIIDNWNKVVNKRDLVWVLGDTAFSEEGFEGLLRLNGRKKKVRGNHDDKFTTEQWLEVFETVEGITKYKGFWLTHCPIHPQELRGRCNIHGHLHHKLILDEDGLPDIRYVNVSCEQINETPINFEEIKNRFNLTGIAK
jgi:calcineurin-like phosphoesterase family protein